MHAGDDEEVEGACALKADAELLLLQTGRRDRQRVHAALSMPASSGVS